MNTLTTEQLQRVQAFWKGCIKRKAGLNTPIGNSAKEVHAYSVGQMDGFERALHILTGRNPYDILDEADKVPPLGDNPEVPQ